MANADCLEAFQLLDWGWKHKQIADKFSVSRSAVSKQSKNRPLWKQRIARENHLANKEGKVTYEGLDNRTSDWLEMNGEAKVPSYKDVVKTTQVQTSSLDSQSQLFPGKDFSGCRRLILTLRWKLRDIYKEPGYKQVTLIDLLRK